MSIDLSHCLHLRIEVAEQLQCSKIQGSDCVCEGEPIREQQCNQLLLCDTPFFLH